MSKCQAHAGCVIYCETPEQVAAGRCEYCLEFEHGSEAMRLRMAAIVAAATELLDQLDALAAEEEPSAGQRAGMERLRETLAA
ncbi:hypothetical protein G7007_20730 [Pseudomonas entomophila]|uniref:hypothetical protein n=1 Tax=Pseudomonas entomophila TaxID=312306 RepID=UPI0015E3B450|nr:hypothetical protein [Pseudomonas entomophila]MBA1195252.1 hypothetical protein [Pseudomonas entomophila]